MKLIKLLALTVLIPSLVFADNIAVVNSSQATLYGSQGIGGPVSMDTKGNLYVNVIDGGSGLTQSVIPVSSNPLNGAVTDGIKAGSVMADDTIEAASTRTVLNLTANVAAVGDYIIPTGGTAANLGKWYQVCDRATNTVTLCGTGLDATPSTDTIRIFRYRPLSATGTATDGSAVGLLVSLNRFYQNGNGGDLLKAEDAAHTTGDAGVAGLGVINLAYATQAADGDYANVNLDRAGRVGIRGSFFEDYAYQNGDDMVAVGGQASAAIAQTVGTALDVAPFAMDLGNRLVTTNAPAGETISACSSAATNTSNTTIISGIPSNRFYATSISCYNTASVASAIEFKNGTSVIYAGGIGNSTLNGVGVYTATLPVPLRTSVNTAFNFAMLTTATNTVCCVSGYQSTI